MEDHGGPRVELTADGSCDGDDSLSPGLKYKHYQPDADMILYEGEPDEVTAAVQKAAEKERAKGRKTGIIDFNGDVHEAARLFFARLRDLDKQGVDLILCAGVPDAGLGESVMDRMRKAAGENIVCVSKGDIK